mgnify:CR=1 FL=1
MDELILSAKAAHANAIVLYYKAAAYHWNVECKNFIEMHEFFGDYYDDVYGSVDKLAEEMRTLGAYTPCSLNELYNFKTIVEDSDIPASVEGMLVNLGGANAQMLECLNKLFDQLAAAKKQGYANFIADRIDAHEKHAWMIKSFLKSGE